MATANSNARAHRPTIDRSERYQSWRDAAQSARILSERTGRPHRPYMAPDGSLSVTLTSVGA